jgi:hypothetical protein
VAELKRRVFGAECREGKEKTMSRQKVIVVLRDAAVLSLMLLTGVAIRASLTWPWIG